MMPEACAICLEPVLYFPSMHYHDNAIGRGVGPRIMVESVAERARQLFAVA